MIQLSKPVRPLVLIILDGWGLAPEGPGNAISQANLPYYHSISASYPHAVFSASGAGVGLPEGEVGNSEVGHLNIGAGKIVYQDLTRINAAIADNSFLQNQVFIEAFINTKAKNSSLHLVGLVGSGKINSSLEHLYSLLLAAKENNVRNVYLHLFTDGVDSRPGSALSIISEIETRLKKMELGKIASISGRYWAMDREGRFDRIEKVYNTMVVGEGDLAAHAEILISSSYAQKIDDDLIPPTLISEDGEHVATINDNDSVIFFNFRADRARELVAAMVDPNFSAFTRKKWPKNLFFVGLTEYESRFHLPTAYPRQKITEPLARVISDYSLKQLHIAETEKFPHVTYFFNGEQDALFPLETHIEIPSLKVPYETRPEMSTREITSYTLNKLSGDVFDFYLVNFASPDMLAHTGSISATVKGLEVVDECLAKIGKETLLKGGAMIVTSDHGNAEEMINPLTGQVSAEHTTNKVPFIVVAQEFLHSSTLEFPTGNLADVAPTVLSLLGISKPDTLFGTDHLEIKLAKKQFAD